MDATLMSRGIKYLYFVGTRKKEMPVLVPLSVEEWSSFCTYLEAALPTVRNERDRYILTHFLGLLGEDKKALGDIGLKLDISRSRVGQLYARAKLEIFRIMDKQWRAKL